jgi:hypothetical protein
MHDIVEVRMEILTATGPWMYPLLIVAGCLLVSIVHSFHVIWNAESGSSVAPVHHAVLGWGVLAGVVGLLGTVIGFGKVAVGARAVTGSERAELESMLAVLWDGVMVIVTPVTIGLWLFTIALIAWLGLHYLTRQRLG